jgi:hypothetical protein
VALSGTICAVLAGGAATAASRTGTGKVTFCATAKGVLYKKSGTCPAHTTKIVVNAQGPAGPQGIPGPQGVPGVKGDPGPAGAVSAVESEGQLDVPSDANMHGIAALSLPAGSWAVTAHLTAINDSTTTAGWLGCLLESTSTAVDSVEHSLAANNLGSSNDAAEELPLQGLFTVTSTTPVGVACTTDPDGSGAAAAYGSFTGYVVIQAVQVKTASGTTVGHARSGGTFPGSVSFSSTRRERLK